MSAPRALQRSATNRGVIAAISSPKLLWLLHAQGLALLTAGAIGEWKISAAGRARLAPRRGPARSRPLNIVRVRSSDRRQKRSAQVGDEVLCRLDAA